MRQGLSTALALGLSLLTSLPVLAQTTKPAYPDTTEGLTQLFKDLLAASEARNQIALVTITKTMVLPDHEKWFTKTFGETIAPRLIKEFEQTAKGVDVELAVKFFALKEPGKLVVDVKKYEAADDLNARIFQRLALSAMLRPTALYSVTLTLPGTSAKIEIWSVVYTDGAFRVAGKMQAIRG